MKRYEIRQITHLPSQIQTLEKHAIDEGFRFLTRLISEWNSGANRFDAPGECLMAALLDGCLVGIGGLSVDPYVQGGTGRLRRLYVAPSARGQNIGRALVERLVDQAARHFYAVRLFTDTTEGDAFYRRCGFQRTEGERATHSRVLDYKCLDLSPVPDSQGPTIG